MGMKDQGEKNDARNTSNSPVPNVVPGKQDLNMTAPLHSEQVKNGRRFVDQYVGSPIQNVGKILENSLDY